jgi:hypothetical protein
MSKEPQYKHFFTVKNGKFAWEEPDMFDLVRRRMEGKRGFAIIDEVDDKVTLNQFAYYFGGIIRMECMKSNVFYGLSEKEIHQMLFERLRGYTKTIEYPDGRSERKFFVEDFSVYSKKDMSKYIEELIPLLITEFNIHPKPASNYKYNQFYINPKTLHKEDKK